MLLTPGLPGRVTLALLVFVLAAAPADAQFRRSQKPFAEQGDFALMAEISGLEVLRLQPALDGIGARYRVADQTVIGASVGLNIQDASSSSDTDVGDQESDRNATRARLSTWVEQHVGRRSRAISPFVGAGVTAEVSSFDQTNTQPIVFNGQQIEIDQRSSDNGFAVGGGVFIGAEVRLTRGLTLGGAYTLGLEYRSDTSETTTSGFPDQPPVEGRFDTSGLTFGTGVTDLVLSVYF